MGASLTGLRLLREWFHLNPKTSDWGILKTLEFLPLNPVAVFHLMANPRQYDTGGWGLKQQLKEIFPREPTAEQKDKILKFTSTMVNDDASQHLPRHLEHLEALSEWY